MIWQVVPYELQFKHPAKTSRDTLVSKKIWFLHLIENDQVLGVGEVAPIFGLSKETLEEVESELHAIVNDFRTESSLSSVQCAMEMAISAQHNGSAFQPFAKQAELAEIEINGLVWMNELPSMRQQALDKIADGNRCVKLKIGALQWKEELKLIEELRSIYSSETLTLRVDANGAFPLHEIKHVLDELSNLDIHSIEQPIRAGQPKELFELAVNSPVPVALDEELIGQSPESLSSYLRYGKPQYLVLKPSIHGGFRAAKQWMNWADEHGINYWVTSALESNIGLNAIARWVCQNGLTGVQGLGTGGLFTNNTEPYWKTEGAYLIPLVRA